MGPLTRVLVAAAAGSGAVLLTVGPAGACGGLVGQNGSIELLRTTTLAAWSDGVEHYVTSFEFSGEGESVGSIIPLPAEPTDVVRGGDWTLQRLQREVAPPPSLESARDFGAQAAVDEAGVEILLETEIDALDITVLAGGGDEVGEWAIDNGFLLTPDAPEVLDFYAQRSPVFLAAKFDASRAAEQGLASGQGTPVHITMETPRPWVPLRILGLGLDDDRRVEADVFLLTDGEPELLAGGDGLDIERSEQANDLLLDDLRADVGMEWVPEDMWLTYLDLDEEAGDLTYDLSASGGTATAADPTLTAAGIGVGDLGTIGDAFRVEDDGSSGTRSISLAIIAVGGAALLAAGCYAARRP